MVLIGMWHRCYDKFPAMGRGGMEWECLCIIVGQPGFKGHSSWLDVQVWRTKVWNGFGMVLTFHYVAIGWIFFALPTPDLSWRVLGLLTGAFIMQNGNKQNLFQWRVLGRVIVKALLLFAIINLLMALISPLPALGRISAYNSLFPGRGAISIWRRSCGGHTISAFTVLKQCSRLIVWRQEKNQQMNIG